MDMDIQCASRTLLTKLLQDFNCGSRQVIRALTTSAHARYCTLPSPGRLEWQPMMILPKASRSTAEHFQTVRRHSRPVEEVFGKVEQMEVLDQAALDLVFAGELNLGWDRFRRSYPESKGIVEVSCPGFSRDLAQAMIEIGISLDRLFGFGECCLYVREGQRWTMVSRKETWAS